MIKDLIVERKNLETNSAKLKSDRLECFQKLEKCDVEAEQVKTKIVTFKVLLLPFLLGI